MASDRFLERFVLDVFSLDPLDLTLGLNDKRGEQIGMSQAGNSA